MVLIAEKHKLLWFGGGWLPENVSATVAEGWDVITCNSTDALAKLLPQAELLLISLPGQDCRDPRLLSGLLDEVDRSGAVAIVMLPVDLVDSGPLAGRKGQFLVVPDDISPAELAGRIKAAAALQPAIKRLREDVAAVRSFGAGIARDFEQLDEEMRLAARLQRDFLPRSLPQIGPIQFSSLFRPAGWVSGDIYDVLRLDEAHVGFYVADVVGHGMPAALLTMFIKKALQTKRISGNTYEIVPPHEALTRLNEDICQQDLTSCQFCTAVYGIVNIEDLSLRYARGGHPPAVLLAADGGARLLEANGPLLGVFPGEAFADRTASLSAGDRLVAFSDGAEDTFLDPAEPGPAGLIAQLRDLRHLPADEMTLQLTVRIDERRASNKHDDDITVIVMDVLES